MPGAFLEALFRSGLAATSEHRSDPECGIRPQPSSKSGRSRLDSLWLLHAEREEVAVSEESELQGWHRLIGRWETEGSHPMLPGEAIRGTSTFKWLDGQRFVIWRSHYDHSQIPDAITIIGITDGRLSMHYFDQRGVYRVYYASLDQAEWRYWREAPAPDFSQRFTGTFSDDGNTITGRGQLSQDGSTWEDDLALDYQRVA
jgi:hypothetical protein